MQHRAIIRAIEQLAPQVLQVTVAVEDESFHFVPGQWVNFRFPEGVSRAYTIASAPQHPGELQICVRTGAGKGADALRLLEAGATVVIDGPFGLFVVSDADRRGLVFLAGDTGIAPVRSIVLHLLATNDPRNVTVLYEPDRRHILYAGDFDPLARSGAITHESGAIETLIERNRKLILESSVMLVGFDPFIERARESLARIGVSQSSVVEESFGAQP